MDIQKLKKAWFELNQPLGKKLGYPDCCIQAFCDQPPELLKRQNPSKDDVRRYKAGCINGQFTGFIPCAFHAKEILAKKISIESLIKNRDPKFLPFPLM